MQSRHLVDFQRLVATAGDLPGGSWMFGVVSSAVSYSQDCDVVALDLEIPSMKEMCVQQHIIVVFETTLVVETAQ